MREEQDDDVSAMPAGGSFYAHFAAERREWAGAPQPLKAKAVATEVVTAVAWLPPLPKGAGEVQGGEWSRRATTCSRCSAVAAPRVGGGPKPRAPRPAAAGGEAVGEGGQ